jgi:hypothetical protein
MALLEALEHFEAAGDQRGAVESGMRLARYLRATHQSKAALGVYRRVLAALPRGATRERVEATIAAGELHAVVGDVDDGIQSLRSLTGSTSTLCGCLLCGNASRIFPIWSEGFWLKLTVIAPLSRRASGNVRELRNLIHRACLEDPEGITLETVERCLESARVSAAFSPTLLTAEPLPVLKERLEREYSCATFGGLAGARRACANTSA